MNIAIVSCFLSNEMRVRSVYDYFVRRGDVVTVFESDFMHLKKMHRENPPKDYIYIPTLPYKKNMSLGRLYSHKIFSKDVVRRLKQYSFDLIYVLIPPNSLVRDLIEYKRRTRVKVIFDVIDLWPESLPVKVSKDLFPFLLWKRLRSCYINEADYIITQCDLYQKYLNVNEEKRKTIYFCKEKQDDIARKKKGKKGEIVFNELDPVNSIGFVCYGNISIKTYTYNEKEYEINNISGNSLFGEFMLFSNNPVFLGTGITVKETKVIYLSKKELIECMGNQRFSENYLSLISSISRNIQRKVKVLSQKEIRDKILFILYDNLKQNNIKICILSNTNKVKKVENNKC